MKKNILFIGVIFVCSLLFLGCPASVITSDSTGLELSITMPVVSKNRLINVSRSTETDKYWEAKFILQEQTKDEINVLQNLSLQLNQGENATVKFEKIDIDRTVRVVVEILSIETGSLCYIGESDWHKVNAGSNHIVIELNKLVSAQSPVIEEHPKSIIKVYSDETEKEPAAGILSVNAKVLDEGILSYQWYECDDLQKSNPRLLQGETNSEIEVNEENISYYYCEVVNTNNSVSGKKVSVVETNVATVASVVGELKEIKSEYDDTKYEIYGEQIDYKNILITEVYFNSIVKQEVEVKLCADREKYTIETDHDDAFGYVPYTVKHNSTQLQSNVRILVKYEPQITINSDNHVEGEGVDGTSEEKAVPISQYIEVLKIKPSVSCSCDVFKTNISETAETINFEEYITFEEEMADGTIIIQSFDDNIFCEEGNQSCLIKGKVTNTNIMDLIIEPEIEYYVNVIPLTIELIDQKTFEEIDVIQGGAQYDLSLKDRKNNDVVEGVTYSIDEESGFEISENFVKIPAQLPIAQNCTVKAKKNGKEIAIKELVLPADLELYEDGLYFDSQKEVLIIEDDEGLKTFVTIINKTMTKSLFVKYSDDSENYETFIAGGNYSNISAKLSNDVTLSNGISIGCSSDTPYRGVFDGNGKTIKIRNVKFETIQDDGIVTFGNALFGYTENAIIKNLTVATKEDEASGSTKETIEVTITEDYTLQTVYLGGIIGNAKSTTLEQCINYRKLDITESCDADNFYCAGLVAYAEDACKYDKCINIGSISSTTEEPLCGFENRSENGDSTFTNCLNCGSFSGGPNSFGFAKGGIYTNCVDVGDAGTPFGENASFSNCYYSGDVLPGGNIDLTEKSKLEIIEFTTDELPNWKINKAPYIYPLPFDVSNCENYPELFYYDLKISDVDTLRANLESPENEERIIFVDIENLSATQITINRPVVLLADKTKTLTLSTTDALFVPRQDIKLCGFNFNGNSNSCSVIDNSDSVEGNYCYSIELSNCMFKNFGQVGSDKTIINISKNDTSLKLDGCTFENNNQLCILLDKGWEANIENSFFNNNVVTVENDYASCIKSFVKTNIQKSEFYNNEADKIITTGKIVYGGAISLYGVDFTVSGCVFENDIEKSICDIYVNRASNSYNYLILDGKVDISAIIVSDYQVSKIRLGESFQFLKKEEDDKINLYGTSAIEDMFEITEDFDRNQLDFFNFIPGSIL